MKFFLTVFIIIVLIGFAIPQNFQIPVENANTENWDIESFWYYPWGKSGIHKGVDIFSPQGTHVLASTYGIVVYRGYSNNGGNIIYILGPKWRVHYYAHLFSISKNNLSLVSKGEVIGQVGNTGNAKNRPHHLHYSIKTYFPHWWRWDSDTLGWEKMFYLNPIDYMNESLQRNTN